MLDARSALTLSPMPKKLRCLLIFESYTTDERNACGKEIQVFKEDQQNRSVVLVTALAGNASILFNIDKAKRTFEKFLAWTTDGHKRPFL